MTNEFYCKDMDTCPGDCGLHCGGYKCSMCTNDCKSDDDIPTCDEDERIRKVDGSDIKYIQDD